MFRGFPSIFLASWEAYNMRLTVLLGDQPIFGLSSRETPTKISLITN